MSQQITLAQAQVPAHIAAMQISAEQLKAMNAAAAVGTGGGGGVNKIGLKQSRFRLQPAGGQEQVLPVLAIEVALLRVNDGINKTWYQKAYNPNEEAGAPECSSDDGIKPRADSPLPQSATCASCPHNVFGSKINPLNGAKGKSCADTKRMALMAPTNGRYTRPDADVYQLAVPAASLTDFGAFVRGLSSMQTPAAYNMVVVEVSFDSAAQYPKLLFKPVRWLDADEYAVVNGRYDEDEVKRTAGLAEAQTMNVANVPAQPAQQQLPGQQPNAQQQVVQQQPQQQQQVVQQPQQQVVQQPQQQVNQQPQQAAQGDWGGGQPAQQQVNQQPQQQAAQGDWGGGQAVQQPVNQQPQQPQQQAAQGDWGGGQPAQQQVNQQPQQQQPQQQVAQQQVNQQPAQQGGQPVRERGKPSPGKARRNAQEMAEDNAADEADRIAAGGNPNVGQLTPQPVQTQNLGQVVQQAAQQPQQQAAQGDWGGGQPVQQSINQQPQQQPQQQASQGDWGGGQPAQQTPVGAPNQPNVIDGGAAAGAFAGWDD